MDLRSMLNDSYGAKQQVPPHPHPHPPPPPPPSSHHSQPPTLTHHAYPPNYSQHPHYPIPSGGRPAPPPPILPPQSPYHHTQPPQQSPGYPNQHYRRSSSSSQAGYSFPPPPPSPHQQLHQHPQQQQQGHGYPQHEQSPSPYGTPHPLNVQSGSPFTGPGGHPGGPQQVLTPTSANSYNSPHGQTFPTMSPMRMNSGGVQGQARPHPGYGPPPGHPHQISESPGRLTHPSMSPVNDQKVGKVRERMFAERRREKEMDEMDSEHRERDRFERPNERDFSVSPKTKVPMFIDVDRKSSVDRKEDWTVGRTNETYSMSQSPVSQRMPSGTPVPSAFPPPPTALHRSQPPTPTHAEAGLPSPRHPPPSPSAYTPSGYGDKMEIDSRPNTEGRPTSSDQRRPDSMTKSERQMNGYDGQMDALSNAQEQSLTSSHLNMGPPPNIDDSPNPDSSAKPVVKEEPETPTAPHNPATQPLQSAQSTSPLMKRGSFAAPARPQPGQIQAPPASAQSGLSAASPTARPLKRMRQDEPPIFARKASRSSSSSPVIQNRRQPPPGPSAMSQQLPITNPSAAIKPPPPPQQQQQPPLATSIPPPKPVTVTASTASNALGSWEPCITNIQPSEELTRHICDFLFIHVVNNTEFGIDGGPNGALLEIEAKLGVLLDRTKNDRLSLPVLTETILDPDDPSLKVTFRSSMTEIQHKRMNEFLNRTFTESQRQAQQQLQQQPPPSPTAADLTLQPPPRIPLTYKHLRERDSFYEIPLEALQVLPQSISRVPNYRHRLKLRVTTDQKTGKVLNKIIKARIADLNVYSPRTAFDWRISINVEMPWQGEVDNLLPHGGGVAGGGERNKDRLSYQHLCFSVDLTQVTAAIDPAAQNRPPMNQQPPPKKEHELEIEVDARRVREQGVLSMEGKPNGYEDLVRGFVDNVRVLTRELGEGRQ